jgi:archaellum component FlaC
MAEKVKLNEFLREMVKSLNKKLDNFENDISLLRSEIRRLETNQKKESLEEVKDRIKSLESTLSTTRDLNLVDKSILKMLESEENVRRT